MATLKVWDTTRERTRTLPDGSVLVYRRPGGGTLRTIADDAVVEALSVRAKHMEAVPPAERDRFDEGNAKRQSERDQRVERELDGLDRDARRARLRELKFNGIEHHRLIHKCGVSWRFGTEEVDCTDLEGLRDLPADVLEDAARVIYDSHYDRGQDLEGNSPRTSSV